MTLIGTAVLDWTGDGALQNALEQTHYDVGKEVRNIVIKNAGKNPENLPQEKELPNIKKELKQGYKNMIKEDKKKK